MPKTENLIETTNYLRITLFLPFKTLSAKYKILGI